MAEAAIQAEILVTMVALALAPEEKKLALISKLNKLLATLEIQKKNQFIEQIKVKLDLFEGDPENSGELIGTVRKTLRTMYSEGIVSKSHKNSR